jgi:uncharacterized oligopeptide transporter (OPT) family protein
MGRRAAARVDSPDRASRVCPVPPLRSASGADGAEPLGSDRTGPTLDRPTQRPRSRAPAGQRAPLFTARAPPGILSRPASPRHARGPIPTTDRLPAAATAAGPRPTAELTARALLAGAGIGVVLAIANLYMGLKTGLWDSGSITAAILGFAVLSWRSRGAHSPLEDVVVATTASSVGAMPAVAGLLGAVPALALLGEAPGGLLLVGWGIAIGVLGLAVAVALRRRLLEDEALPFPSGLATAELIGAMHATRGERRRARLLLGAGAAGAVFTALRDGARLVPAVAAWPWAVAGVPGAALTLGVAWSPMLVGVGALAGLRTGGAVVAGAVAAWGVLAPALAARGLVASTAYADLAPWLVWPGVGLMVGGAAAGLVAQAGAFAGGLRDLLALRRGAAAGAAGGRREARIAAAAAALAAIATVALARAGFGLPAWQGVVALGFGAALSVVCARAAGQTDICPAAEMGQLTETAWGALAPGRAGVTIAAGAIPAGQAAEAAVALWSLQAGRRLGANPRLQARAQLVGIALGALVAVPAYLLLVRVDGIGTAALPAPFAYQWKSVAEVVTRGAGALPPGAAWAASLAFAAGVVLERLGRGRLARVVPSPMALGMGFLVPAYYAAALCAGGLLAEVARRRRPGSAGAVQVLAAGAIVGESLAGLAVAMLVAAGVLAR